MENLELILTFGFWPAVPLAGYVVLTAGHRQMLTPGRVERAALASAIGIAAWSPALLMLVAFRAYSPVAIGVIGWMVIGGVLGWRLLARPTHHPGSSTGTPGAWDLLLAGGLILAAVLAFGFPGEFVIGGRDENSYTLHAMWIAEHRRLDIPYPWPGELHSMFYDAFLRWSGTFRTEPTMTPAFGHVFPVWLAQAMTTFGYEGMLRLNGAFSLIATLVIYGFCRSIVSKPLAVAVALILALNPASLWISRTPLTEVLTQMLLWSALWLIVMALRRDMRLPASLAGVMLGVAVLVRIDMLLTLPLMVLAHLATTLVEDDRAPSAPVWSAFYAAALPSIVLAGGYYLAFSRPYVFELMPQLIQIAALAAVAVIVLYAGTRGQVRQRLRPAVGSRVFLLGVGIALTGLALYAWFIRPIDEPFRVFSDSQVGLAGKRTFAEESLRDLAAYLSVPVVMAALAGWFATLWIATRTRSGWWMPLLLVSAGFAFLYLWSPSITPDHFWAIRRFVPAVIPAFVVLAGVGGWLALRERPRGWSGAAGLAAVLLFGAFAYQAFRPFVFEAEHNGYRTQLAALAAQLPDEEPVLALNGERWWKPLYVAFNRRVINLSLASSEGVSAARSWIAHEFERGNEPVVIGVGHHLPMPGLRYERIHAATLVRDFHDGSRRPLPTGMTSDSVDISVFRIQGIDESYTYTDTDLHVGLRWGLVRTGFHDPEKFRNEGVAWTDGHGKISVPIRGDPPRSLSLSVLDSAAAGAELSIAVNGMELFRGPVPGDGLRTMLPLDAVSMGSSLVIELMSDSVQQQRTVPIDGSLYRREIEVRSIGVAVQSLMLVGTQSPAQ